MKKLIISAFILLAVQHEASAGISVVGNGGDVVDCGPNQPLLLLDVYEKVVLGKKRYYLNEFPGAETEKLSAYLNTLKNYGPYQSELLSKTISHLKQNTTWTTEDLKDIPDSQHVFLPEGCQIRQIAIQNREEGQSDLVINRLLYDRLDETNKAALWLHEGTYAEAIDLGHGSSIGTRALNGTFIAGEYYGENDINSVRAQNRFYTFRSTSQGDTVIFSLASDPCGVVTRNGFSLPCGKRFSFEFKEDRLNWIEFRDGFAGFGLKFKVSRLYLYEAKVVLHEDTPYRFDGKIYQCKAQQLVSLSNSNFTPGLGYRGPALFLGCVGKYEGAKLPVHYTQRLANDAAEYQILFSYVFDRHGSHEAGLQFIREKGSWNLGFTPFENLNFNSYQENWYAQQVRLENTTGQFREPKADGLNCELNGKAKLSVREATPRLLEAQIKAGSVNCQLATPKGMIELAEFKRDVQGNVISGIASDKELPFMGQREKFKGAVEFRDNSVVRGTPVKSVYGNFEVNGYQVSLLPGEGLYQVLRGNKVRIIDSSDLKRNADGTYRYWGDNQVNLPAGLQSSSVSRVHVSSGTLSPRLELMEGSIEGKVHLNVCYFDANLRTVKRTPEYLTSEEVRARSMYKQTKEDCVWVYGKDEVVNIPGVDVVLNDYVEMNVCSFEIKTELLKIEKQTLYPGNKIRMPFPAVDPEACVWKMR